MDTEKIKVENGWVEITDGNEAQFTLQNVGSNSIILRYATTAPTAGEDGLVLAPFEGVTSTIHGIGATWARSYSQNSPSKIVKVFN